MKKLREADKIRESSLAVGSKKLAEGCDGCADGYFELARRHGATEEDIQVEFHRQRPGEGVRRHAAGESGGQPPRQLQRPHPGSSATVGASQRADDAPDRPNGGRLARL